MVVVKASVVLPISVVENTLVVGTIAGVASDDIGAVSVVALQLDVVVAPVLVQKVVVLSTHVDVQFLHL